MIKRPAKGFSQLDKSGQLLTRPTTRARSFHPLHHGGVKPLPAWFLIFGVGLPLAALLYETNSHYCAGHYFDPFPSTGHILLFALIPLSNLLTWFSSRRDLSNHFAAMALTSGMALGVGVLYTLMFLPLTAASCFAIAFGGFGLLGLSPLISLPFSWYAGKAVCRMAHAKATYFNPHQVEHVGHMIILVMVLAVELPSTLTRVNLSRAAESNQNVASPSLAWLRKYGSVEVMQRACYERSGRATDILGSMYENVHPLSTSEARRIFYQVTGKPFNTVAIPVGARATIKRANIVVDSNNLNAGVADEFDFDDAIAGESVAGIARGLSATKSKIDCEIDPDAALATLNMSFDLVNVSQIDREARAEIALPPDAVITAAYLDVGGKSYEAQISVREAARAQYQVNVQARKAPLLVSMVGSGTAMLQCYPVSPGHPLHVTIKMAVPLTVMPGGRAQLMMPAFAEQNFAASDPVQIVSKIGGGPQTSSTVKAQALTNFGADITVPRNASITLARTDIDKYVSNSVVERTLKPMQLRFIKKVDVVIDTSAPMQPYLPAMYKAFADLPAGLSVNFRLVGDRVQNYDYQSGLAALKSLQARGGQDDSDAVVSAVESANKYRDGAIVLWIHGFQPESSNIQGSKKLREILGASYLRPTLFDFPISAAANPLLAGVYAPHGLVHVPRSSVIGKDLDQFFQSCSPAQAIKSPALKGDSVAVAALSKALGMASVQTLVANEYDSHPRESENTNPNFVQSTEPATLVNSDARLAQIWANREIGYKQDGPYTSVDDLRLIDWHIVSPLSSAIIAQTAFSDKAGDVAALKQKAEASKNRWDISPDAVPGRLSFMQSRLAKDLQQNLKRTLRPQFAAKEEDHELAGRKIDPMYVASDAGSGNAPPMSYSQRQGSTNAAAQLDSFNSLGGPQIISGTSPNLSSGSDSQPISDAKELRLDSGDPRYHPPHQTSTRPRDDIALVFVIISILLGTLAYALRRRFSKKG